jgi:starch-binding outer membrane protein, SusD/RagB family
MSEYTKFNIDTAEAAMNLCMTRRKGWRAAATLKLLAVGAVVLFVGACDALDRALSVDSPHLVDANDMTNPVNAPVLVTGLISDFDCAFGAYVVNGGLLGNELRDASVTAARFSLDARTIDDNSPYGTNSCSGNPPGTYVPLATAIWTSNNALTRLDGWSDAEVPFRTGLIAQAAAYSGYSLVLMGEGFCSAVIEELGPEVNSQQVFQTAEARFTQAIAAADAMLAASSTTAAQRTTMTDIRNMALLGRARTRLNGGNLANAAADARAVLTSAPTYTKVATASAATTSARRWNRVTDEFIGGRITVEPSYMDLTIEGVPDTRVTVINTNTNGHDGSTRVHVVAKYLDNRNTDHRARPLPIATWREAHLIIAEAEGGAEAVTRVNLLRAHHNLPAYAGPQTAEAIRDLIIRERARELYLEGHHLNDLRRFNLPNTPAVGTAYRQGGSYGSVRCFPLPAVEKNNNPNF